MSGSTPPSDVARFHSLTRAAVAIAASAPPWTRIDSMPPNPPALSARDIVAGMMRQAGIKDGGDGGVIGEAGGEFHRIVRRGAYAQIEGS